MYVEDTFILFLDKMKRHQLRKPLKAALAVVPSLAFAVLPRQPQKHVVPSHGVERKEEVRHNHQTFFWTCFMVIYTICLKNPAEILRNKMNQTVKHICFQHWHSMMLVNLLSTTFDYNVLQICLPVTSTSESFCCNICTWWHLHAKHC